MKQTSHQKQVGIALIAGAIFCIFLVLCECWAWAWIQHYADDSAWFLIPSFLTLYITGSILAFIGIVCAFQGGFRLFDD